MEAPEWLTTEKLEAFKYEAEQDQTRTSYLNRARRAERYYGADKQWWVPLDDETDEDLSDDVPRSVENHLRKTVNDHISIMLKNSPLPRFHPTPGHPEDAQLSDDIDALVAHIWQHSHIAHALQSWTQEACVTGLSVVKVGWGRADKTESKKGDIMMVKIPPDDIYLDPMASNDHRAMDCRYIIHRTRQTPEYIVKRFGDSGAEALGLKTKSTDRNFVKRVYDKVTEKFGPKNMFANISYEELRQGIPIGMGSKDGTRAELRRDVLEYWIFPVTDTEYELVGGEEIEENQFPYGLVVTTIENYIVDIKKNPFVKTSYNQEFDEYGTSKRKQSIIGHRRHPFVPMWWQRCSDVNGYNGTYMCDGAVSAMIPPQVSLNTLLRVVESNATTTANPPITIIDGATDIPADRIKMIPGDIVRINAQYAAMGIDNVFKVRLGAAMPQYVENLITAKRGIIPVLGGINGAMTGDWPGGTSHTPAGTVAALQQASSTPIWTPVRECDAGIRDVSQIILGLIQQYYEVDRFYDVSTNGNESAIKLTKRHTTTNFTVEVVSGATTPLYDIERTQILTSVKDQVMQAITMTTQTGDPIFIEICIIQLENMKYPPVYQYIQLLRKRMQEMEQQKQGMMAMGMANMMGQNQQQGQQGMENPEQMQQGQQEMLPEGQAQGQGEEMDYSGIEALAEEMGINPAELMAKIEAE